MKIDKRRALPEDEALARRLHKLGYQDVVVRQFGQWDEALQETFFQEKWNPANFDILLHNGQECGYLWVEEAADSLFVHEIVILAGYQGRGIGSGALREQMNRARERRLPLRLRVLKENRAAELYRRLGFREYGNSATHILMEWRARDDD